MKFENFDFPGGVDVEKDFGDDTVLGRDPNAKAMPNGCYCFGGELTASCLNCKARQRARAKLAGPGVDPKEVYDVVDELEDVAGEPKDKLKSGFCISCKSDKPLRGSRPAPPNSDALTEKQRHITCEDCLGEERSDE